jgi:hypothetical protein
VMRRMTVKTKRTSKSKTERIQSPTLAGLTAITSDPIDALRLAADLFALTAYRAKRDLASAAGLAEPRAPEPQSKYLQLLLSALNAKLRSIAGYLDEGDLERMTLLGPAVLRRMEMSDPDVAEQVLKLVCMTPEDAAAWIREHLDELETRYAS